MNGYEMLASGYKKLRERDDVDTTYCDKNIKVLEMLASLSQDEIYYMFDSSAFNEIVKAYVKVALKNCKMDPDVVLAELNCLFSECTAAEIVKR